MVTWATVADNPAGMTSASDVSPPTGSLVHYRVRAFNGTLPSSWRATTAAIPPAGTVQTLANPSFESPVIGDVFFAPVGAGWQFAGPGAGITAAHHSFGAPNLAGAQSALLQGAGGSISQDIVGLVPGRTYTLQFLAAQRSGNDQTVQVTMGGVALGTIEPPTDGGMRLYQFSVAASAATETLAFTGLNSIGGDNTLFIDDVFITSPLPAVTLDQVRSHFGKRIGGPGWDGTVDLNHDARVDAQDLHQVIQGH